MSLGEETLTKKENEITAIPKLLDLISIKDCIITSVQENYLIF